MTVIVSASPQSKHRPAGPRFRRARKPAAPAKSVCARHGARGGSAPQLAHSHFVHFALGRERLCQSSKLISRDRNARASACIIRAPAAAAARMRVGELFLLARLANAAHRGRVRVARARFRGESARMLDFQVSRGPGGRLAGSSQVAGRAQIGLSGAVRRRLGSRAQIETALLC